MTREEVTLFDVFEAIGEVKADGKTTGKRIDCVERNLSVLTASTQQLGKEFALLMQEHMHRGARLGEVERRLEVTEDTGVHHIMEEKTRWRTVKVVVAIIVGALSFTATTIGLTASSCKPSAPSLDGGKGR